MDTEEGDFIVCGDGGSVEDVQFDELVGVIEDFMAKFDQKTVFELLPPFSSVHSDHKKHEMHKEVLSRIEEDLDAYVLEECHSVKSMEEASELLLSRQDELEEEVLDFISNGCFDYITFLKLWEEYEKDTATE